MKKGYSSTNRNIRHLSVVLIGRVYSEALLYNIKRLIKLCGHNFKGRITDPARVILTCFVLVVLLANNVTGQITLVGQNSTNTVSSGNIVLNKPTGVAAGDIMIVTIVANKNQDLTSNGWTSIQANLGSNSRRAAVLYRTAVAADDVVTSYTFSVGNNASAVGAIVAYTGVNGFDVTPGSITALTVANTTVSPTSIITNTPGALVIMLGMSIGTGGVSPTFRTFDSWTLATSPVLSEIYDIGSNLNSVGAATGIQNCPGETGNGAITVSGSAFLGGIILALKPRVDTWWTGLNGTDWNDALNWSNGIPLSTSNVIIPSCPTNQPVVSALGTANCYSLLIGTGATLTVEPTAQMTVTTSITNNGTLNLESEGTRTASLMVGSFSGNDANIELYLSSGYWHYISSPVDGLSVNEFAEGNDLAQFVESLPATTSGELDPPSWQKGWIAWDGWSYHYDEETEYTPSTYYYGNTYAFSSLALGKGYNYWNTTAPTFSFSGQINTTDPSPSITYSGDDPVWSGYNLLGNPYSCGIDLQYLLSTLWQAAPIFKSVYYTINDVSYTVSQDGTSVPSGASLLIPPMQGFFVKATGDGNLSFSTSARIHTSTPRYKGEQTSSIPLVRLSINENGKTDETVVRFNEKATAGLDVEFDAPKFIGTPGNPSIYTSMNGTDFTINGIPFPETSVEIPVVLNLLADGNHSINAMELQELDNYQVFLKDKITNSTVDLKSVREYSFSALNGLIKDRFTLTVTNMTTGIEDPVKPADAFNIYSGFDLINIQPLSDEWDGKTGIVKIIDFSGKPVRYLNNTEFNKNSLIQIPAPEKGGLYFVEIRSGLMKFVGKVVVK